MSAQLPPGFELETPTASPATLPPAAPQTAPAADMGLPEGFELEAPAAPPPAGAEEYNARLKQMLDSGQPLEDIRKFVGESAFDLTPDTDKWLDLNYDKWRETMAARPEGYDVQSAAPDSFDVETPEPFREMGTGESAWLGLQSSALRGFDDELVGASGAVGNKIGSALGMNESTASFSDIYEELAQKQRDEKDAAWDQNPVAYGAGFVPGMFLGYRLKAGPAGAMTKMERAKRAGQVGFVEGALSGAGNADPGAEGSVTDRIMPALAYGAGGAVLGPVIDAGVNAIGSGARSLYNRFGPPKNSPNSGINVLNERAPLDTDAMRAEQARFTEAGVNPRIVDIVPDEARSVIRRAAAAPTPARQEVANAAERTYADVPERVAAQAGIISDSPLTARQITNVVEQEQRSMGPQFDAVRNEPVEITPEMTAVLGTGTGRAALRRAAKWLDPEAEGAVVEFIRGMNQANKLGSVDEQAAKLVPGWAGMSDSAKAQLLPQLGLSEGVGGGTLTVDIVDKWARAINKAAETDNMFGPAREMVEAIRGAARQQHPDYDAALTQFGQRAGVGEAAAGTGRFEDTSFLKTPADQFVENIRPASAEPAAGLRGGDTAPAAGTLELRPNPDGMGGPTKELIYYTPEGMTVRGRLTPKGDGKAELDIDQLYSYHGDELGPNDLGPAGVRDLMRSLRDQGYTEVSGSRVSGARRGTAQQNEVVTQNIPSAAGRPTVSEADALAARARQEVTDRAYEGNAMQVARDVASGTGQQSRNAALLGGRRAQRLEDGMRAEVDRVDNMVAIDPRAGKQARLREGGGRDAIVEGFQDAVAGLGGAAVGSKYTVIRIASKWLTQGGIRNVDAERLSRDAISNDPARVEAAISFLEQQGMARGRAAKFVSTFAGALGGRAFTGKADQSTPPNSVRAILRETEQ